MRLPRHLLHLLALLAAVVLGVACGVSGDPPSARRGSVEVVGSALGAEDVASATLTMTRTAPAAPVETRTTSLIRTGTQWRALIGDLPLGTWTFDATATDLVDAPIFRAHAEGIVIDGLTVPVVLLVFQPAIVPVPYANTAPLIDALAISTAEPIAGEVVRIQATAHDPNPGDTLSYAWLATGGSFSRTTDTTTAGPATITTEWTAPAAAGDYRLDLTVRDDKGLLAGLSFTLLVKIENTSSSSSSSSSSTSGEPPFWFTLFSATFNHWPSVDRVVSVSERPIDAEDNPTTSITATASDLDGQRLHIEWTAANCAGTFAPSASADMTGPTDGAQTSTVTFTRTDTNDVATCDIIATVSDGAVANTGTLFLATRGAE